MKKPVKLRLPLPELPPPKIDPKALVRKSVKIGRGSVVWAFATVHEGVVIGENCSIAEHVYIGRNTTIGDGTRIGQGAHITDHMHIGQRVFIGPHVTFANDRHPRVNNPLYKREPPVVEDDVSIGENATINPGVTLGRGCVVGALAMVTKSVGLGATVVGNPARAVRPMATVVGDAARIPLERP